MSSLSVPDPELLLVGQLTDLLGLRVVTELPEPLVAPASLPIVHVYEIPGGTGSASTRLDVCVFDFDAYAPGRDEARALAEDTRQMLLAAPGWWATTDGQMWVSRIQVDRPCIRPYDDATDIRRYGGTGRVWLRYRRPS